MNKLKVNPLNVFKIRKVSFPAYHFFYTNELVTSDLKKIDQWMYTHLKGRYFIGPGLSIHNNIIEYIVKIGFEVEKELSFFKLACPYIIHR
jgi:hypothetical protein